MEAIQNPFVRIVFILNRTYLPNLFCPYFRAPASSIAFYCDSFLPNFRKIIVAIKDPTGPNIGKTVKTGVLTLILMNAAWVSLSGQWEMAIFVVLLLPVSIRLGKKFAVT